MSWLPIESAPRFVRSLVWLEYDGPVVAVNGRYGWTACPSVGRNVVVVHPTHWQPLPGPPTDDRWELTEAGRAMRGGK